MTFYSFGPHIPEIEPDTFIAPGSFIIGKVYLGRASIWYRCVLRVTCRGLRWAGKQIFRMDAYCMVQRCPDHSMLKWETM